MNEHIPVGDDEYADGRETHESVSKMDSWLHECTEQDMDELFGGITDPVNPDFMNRLFRGDTSPSDRLCNWTQQGSPTDQLEDGNGTEENFNFSHDDQQPAGKKIDDDADMDPRPEHQHEEKTDQDSRHAGQVESNR